MLDCYVLEQTSYKSIVTYRFFKHPFGPWKNHSKRTCKKTNDHTNAVDDDNSEDSVPHIGQFVDPQIPRPENRQTIPHFNLENLEIPRKGLKIGSN